MPTELINGEIFVAPAPRDSHQKTVFRAAKYIESIAPEGEIRVSPIDVYLDDINVVQPDVMWNGVDSPCVLVEDAYWRGAPDLVVEVLSPSTALRDKSTKFQLYEQFGVREYWIIDPTGQYIEVYVLTAGKFARQGVFGGSDSFTSAVLAGKSVAAAAIFGHKVGS